MHLKFCTPSLCGLSRHSCILQNNPPCHQHLEQPSFAACAHVPLLYLSLDLASVYKVAARMYAYCHMLQAAIEAEEQIQKGLMTEDEWAEHVVCSFCLISTAIVPYSA